MLQCNMNRGPVGSFLTNPNIPPSQISLVGESLPDGVGPVKFVMDDADHLFSTLNGGTFNSTNGMYNVPGYIPFKTAGSLSIKNYQEYLKSYALVICGFNFQSSDATQLANNLEIVATSLDGVQASRFIFSSQAVSNLQTNPNLLNVDKGFVLTNQTAIRMSGNVASPANLLRYTLTFNVVAAVPYAVLSEFLAQTKLV